MNYKDMTDEELIERWQRHSDYRLSPFDLARVGDELAKRFKALLGEGWVSVSERLPGIGEVVLVTNGNNRPWMARLEPARPKSSNPCRRKDHWESIGLGLLRWDPTLWRHVPSPPQREKEDV